MDKLNKNLIKTGIIILNLLAMALVLYLIFLPLYPKVVYKTTYEDPYGGEEAQNPELFKERVAEIRSNLPENAFDVSPNRVIIPKIGVNAPIVVSDSAEYGLSLGAWLVPDTSTPDKGGNTVITGHRFKYLPPSNLTFYLFDKLKTGDLVSVIWEKENYLYKIRETKIVPDTEVSILSASDNPQLTMFTCHPIYSTENRLVIVADLLEPEQAE